VTGAPIGQRRSAGSRCTEAGSRCKEAGVWGVPPRWCTGYEWGGLAAKRSRRRPPR